MRRILVFAEERDWHVKRLAAACAARDVALTAQRLSDGAFAIGGAGRASQAIAIPGFEENLPDAVIVRTVGNGSFEQVTLRLSLLHALAVAGVPVINDARAIE